MTIPIRWTALAVFFLLTILFVTAEFAIVRTSRSTIDEKAKAGDSQAIRLKKITDSLDQYLALCQFVITISTLAIGLLSEPLFQPIWKVVFQSLTLTETTFSILSIILTLLAISFVYLLVGELLPRLIAVQYAEHLALSLAPIILSAYFLLRPFLYTLHFSGNVLAKLFGVQPMTTLEVSHTEEELRKLLSNSFKSGEINSAEYKYVNRIFEFDERIAKEIMVPRTEMITIDKTMTLSEVFNVIGVEQFTRYPIVDGDKDHVIGLVNMKHLLTAYIKDERAANHRVVRYVQPIIHAIDSMPINDLLLKIQRERIHMAILVDEYGGTSGLVTIEDILEEIVGEIQDEFDVHEVPEIQKISDTHYIFDAKVLIDSVNETLGITIDEDDIDTIGGWFMSQHFEEGEKEVVSEQGFTFSTLAAEGHHILFIEAKKLPHNEREQS